MEVTLYFNVYLFAKNLQCEHREWRCSSLCRRLTYVVFLRLLRTTQVILGRLDVVVQSPTQATRVREVGIVRLRLLL